MAPFVASEAREILDQVAPEWDEGQSHTFWVCYAVRRLLEINSSAREEDLFALLNHHVERGRSTPGLAHSLFEALIPLLDEEYTRLPLIFEILDQAPVRDLMREQLNMEPSDKLTLDAIFRAHPATRFSYEMVSPVAQTEAEQFALDLINRLEPLQTSAPTPRRFTEAQGNAFWKTWRQAQDKMSIAQINEPLTSRRTADELFPGDMKNIYELMFEGRYGTLDEIAEKLGIKAFRKAYPEDAKFWQSNHTLVECVRALTAN